MSDIQRMPIEEFRAEGYLHEVNRRLLHPLGLALEVVTMVGEPERLGGVWDYRDDPEGMNYGDDLLSAEKAQHIADLWDARREPRFSALGYVVQPVPGHGLLLPLK